MDFSRKPDRLKHVFGHAIPEVNIIAQKKTDKQRTQFWENKTLFVDTVYIFRKKFRSRAR